MNNTLFNRLGGLKGISAIVDAVIDAHMNNPAIQARFIPYREMPERLASIRQHIIDFFCAGSGGPVTYAGRDMTDAHRGMNITPGEYMHVMDDILKVLNAHKIDDYSQKEVLWILYSLKEPIIGQ